MQPTWSSPLRPRGRASTATPAASSSPWPHGPAPTRICDASISGGCGAAGPGSRADEVLLHEFIHIVDKNYSAYTDAQGFAFDGSDFLSVNATNVYSCLLGRGLRKDHHGFNFLPTTYFTTPRKHFDDF